MALKLTVESFLQVVRQSGLIDKDQLQKSLQSYGDRGVDVQNSQSIAEALVADDLITRWQAEKLLAGKHKGFTLGKYRLLDLLGKGGMSSVFLAEHMLMKRRCAIKVLPAKRVNDSSYLARFHREAQAVASVDHPNIVRAYDVDSAPDRDSEIHFLVMEYVTGQSLQELIIRNGPAEYADAMEFIRQAAEGLEHAHNAGLVHRDIKPGNLLLDTNGTVKILDMGLARFFDDKDERSLTVAHDEKVLGTADYLAPEQALDSHKADRRADIYALGCSLYFFLTGHPPFTEGTLAQRLLWHQTKEFPPLTDSRLDCPDSLPPILAKMVAKKPEDRFQTAAEVAHACRDWLTQNAPEGWKPQHIAAMKATAVGNRLTDLAKDLRSDSLTLTDTSSYVMANSPVRGPSDSSATKISSSKTTTPPKQVASEDPPTRITAPQATEISPPASASAPQVPVSIAPPAVAPVAAPVVAAPIAAPVIPVAKPVIPVAQPVAAIAQPVAPVAQPVARVIPSTKPIEPSPFPEFGDPFPPTPESFPPAFEPEPGPFFSDNPFAEQPTPVAETIAESPPADDATVLFSASVASAEEPATELFSDAPAVDFAAESPVASLFGEPEAPTLQISDEPPTEQLPETTAIEPTFASEPEPAPEPTLFAPVPTAVTPTEASPFDQTVLEPALGSGDAPSEPFSVADTTTSSPAPRPAPPKTAAWKQPKFLIGGAAAVALLAVGAWAVMKPSSQEGSGKGGSKGQANSKKTTPAKADRHEVVIQVGRGGEFDSIGRALYSISENKAEHEAAAKGKPIRFVVSVAAGLPFEETIVLDDSLPGEVHLKSDSDRKVKLSPSGNDPAITVKNLAGITIENFFIDLSTSFPSKERGIAVTGNVPRCQIKNCVVSGAGKLGLDLSGAQGGSGNEALMIDNVTLQNAAPDAFGMQIVKGSTTQNVIIRNSRFIGSMAAALSIEGTAENLTLRNNAISGAVHGVRSTAGAVMKNVLVENCSFHSLSKGALHFDELPANGSDKLSWRNNLFAGMTSPELIVAKSYDATKFNALLNTDKPSDNNWSDRPADKPIPGEHNVIGRSEQRVAKIDFASTDAKSEVFLTPKASAPYKSAGVKPK